MTGSTGHSEIIHNVNQHVMEYARLTFNRIQNIIMLYYKTAYHNRVYCYRIRCGYDRVETGQDRVWYNKQDSDINL